MPILPIEPVQYTLNFIFHIQEVGLFGVDGLFGVFGGRLGDVLNI